MQESADRLQRLADEFKTVKRWPDSIPRLAEQRAWSGTAGAASPYPGLRPFLADESRFFRGRDSQVAQIGERLAEQHCVTVLGGSGSGKSSIVRAGVIPALRRKLIPGRGDLWRAAVFTPGRAPIDNLVSAFERTLRGLGDGQAGPDEDFSAERRRRIRNELYHEGRLGALLRMFRDELDVETGVAVHAREQANLLIVIDQFEELFRAENRGKVQVSSLVGLIVDFWRNSRASPGLYLALTMRTDDLHRCAEFIDLPEFVNATSYLTRRLRERELSEAIVAPIYAPLVRAGLIEGEPEPGRADLRPFDVNLVTELLDSVAEIGHDPDHLPLFQHLLAVLWRQVMADWRARSAADELPRQPRVTREHLARALQFESWSALEASRNRRGVAYTPGWLLRECLNRVADGLLKGGPFGAALTRPQQELARVAFCLMGEVDDHGNVRRRWTTREEIARVAGRSAADPDIDAVVRRFSEDHRLIWVRASGEMDVTHEALMRNWLRLAGWLAEDRRAAIAYRTLSDRYARWRDANAALPGWAQWWSWLRNKDGLLRGDTLDQLDSVLLPKGQRDGRPGAYNGHWAERHQGPADGARPGGGPAPDERGEAHRLRFGYLKRSRLRDGVLRKLPVLTLLLAGIVLAQEAYRQHLANERLEQDLIVASDEAAEIWDSLSDWGAVPTAGFVDGLWALRAADEGTRTEFVRQWHRTPNRRAAGRSPQPVVRAVGLVWPDQARDIISDALIEQLAGRRGRRDPLSEPALACTSAVLSERISAECLAQAETRAAEQLQEPSWGPRSIWSKGRILACMGPRLDRTPRLQALDTAFSAAGSALDQGGNSSFVIGGVATALTSAAWLSAEDGRALSMAERSTIDKAVDAVVETLARSGTDDIWMPYRVRPVVSLVPTLPPAHQRFVLERMLPMVAQASRETVEQTELVVVLAQLAELVAADHAAHGRGYQLRTLVARAWQTGDLAAAARDGAPGAVAVLRLLLPLVEVTGTDYAAGREILGLAIDAAPGNSAAVAAWGRRLGLSLPEGDGDRAAAIEARFDEAISMLDAVDTRPAPAVAAASPGSGPAAIDLPETTLDEDNAGPVERAPPPPPATPARPRGPADRFSGVGNGDARQGTGRGTARTAGGRLAREGLARGIAALAAHPALGLERREQAVAVALRALARTGSAEEAAAWAAAIVELVTPFDERERIRILVETMKYPTAALTAREPNALEPQNATDILLQSLVDLVDPGRGEPEWGPGYYIKTLRRLDRAGLLPGVDLTSVPADPRRG